MFGMGNMYGGGYGGGYGQGGGMEMMMIMICCLCCFSIISLAVGYFSNIFCGISTSLGTNCTPKDTAPPDDGRDDQPITSAPNVETCNSARGGISRGGSDPRPPLRAEYCNNGQKVPGRDCHYWKVEADPVTQMARWVREPDPNNPNADMFDGTCRKQVQCPKKIDFTQQGLPGYNDNNPGPLIAKCSQVIPTATNESATIKYLTSVARKVNALNGGLQWTDANSRQWYNRVVRLVAQRDLAPLADNTLKAATQVKRRLGQDRISKWVFATMMEAALRGDENQADWIFTVTMMWVNSVSSQPRQRSEEAYVRHLAAAIKPGTLQTWRTIIDNVQFI
jgi:hypothetical protein